jgi:predicted kinase
MTQLVITRGLPASGKTTWAREWVGKDVGNRVRINRDDLRGMGHNGEYVKGITEPVILTLRDAAIEAALRQGINVVCDDTNLSAFQVRELIKVANKTGAEVEVVDMTDVPLELCLARDHERGIPDLLSVRPEEVGEKVIRDMHMRYLAGKSLPLPVPVVPVSSQDAVEAVKPYIPLEGTPKAILVDLDGTVALMNGRRPYDWDRVGEDLPNEPVINAVIALYTTGHRIIFMSGRDGICMDQTLMWLDTHIPFGNWDLYMRPVGDMRKDSVVKAELFDTYVRDRFHVKLVLDDRDQVVGLWRAMGISCFQVAEGNF